MGWLSMSDTLPKLVFRHWMISFQPEEEVLVLLQFWLWLSRNAPANILNIANNSSRYAGDIDIPNAVYEHKSIQELNRVVTDIIML
jgi:hypothetical protein